MDRVVQNIPGIISAAATSTLGILALLIVAISILSYMFFAKESRGIKLFVFILFFLGVFGFGFAVLSTKHPNVPPESPDSDTSKQLTLITSSPGPQKGQKARSSGNFSTYEAPESCILLRWKVLVNGTEAFSVKGGLRKSQQWTCTRTKLLFP